jgi:hypothetical protein
MMKPIITIEDGETGPETVREGPLGSITPVLGRTDGIRRRLERDTVDETVCVCACLGCEFKGLR